MKKLVVTLITVLSVVSVFAQTNLHINQGLLMGSLSAEKLVDGETPPLPVLVTLESTKVRDRSVTYALIQGSFVEYSFTYAQFFHEIALGSSPFSAHLEFRTYNFNYNVIYAGLSYSVSTENGMVAIEPLYRNGSLDLFHDRGWRWNSSSFQLSVVTGHDWKTCNLNTFTDFYTGSADGSKAGWYSEVWIYFPIFEGIEIGIITQFSAELGSKVNYALYPGFKILF